MPSAWRGISFFVFVAVGLLIVGGVLHIVGLVTPHWHEEKITTDFVTDLVQRHYGLWVSCSLQAIDTFDCGSHETVEGFLSATRAFEVLAILLGAVAIILTGLWAFLKIEKFRSILVISSILIAFLAGGFAIIGIIIYGAKIAEKRKDTSILGQYIENSLGYSFVLCIISGIICVISAILLLVGSRFK